MVSTIRTFFYRIPERERRITTATMFTIARILLTPIIVCLMIAQWWRSACLFFIAAALTDVIDGFLARYLDQKTFLGACLDPVADKIFLFSSFFTLFFINSALFYVPAWFVALMCAKEVLQIIGALLLYRSGSLTAIEANIFGKITTFVQIVFIIWLFGSYCVHVTPNEKIYNGFLLMMPFLMVLSFVQYSVIWANRLKKNKD